MIQFNLLPDVKLEFIKATYRRRIISLFCFLIAGSFITIFVLMFLFVRVNQTKHLRDLDKDINTKVTSLRSDNPDLDKILTIQNQLNSLPSLHQKKVMGSRIFDYLTQLTPNQAAVSSIELDFDANTIILKGSADNLQTVNKFVDTIKFTDFKTAGDNPVSDKAFSSVVLDNFKLDSLPGATTSSKQSVTFSINFTFRPEIFANTAKDGKPLNNDAKLTVPKIITTRSETQKPSDLFKQAAQEQTQAQEAN